MSIRKFILATAAAGGLALFTAGAAGASSVTSSSGESAKTVLDQLCRDRGGQPVFTPYAIARCQGARANKGFDTELQTCEDLADGRFVVVIGTTHMNRANWACIATSPPA
jgi:hypothetical protein